MDCVGTWEIPRRGVCGKVHQHDRGADLAGPLSREWLGRPGSGELPGPGEAIGDAEQTLPHYVLFDLGWIAEHVVGDPADLPDRC
jgi:hypothetical protein